MKKRCLIANGILLVYFFLNLTGFKIGNFILTEVAWREDQIFFFIYLMLLVIFLWKERVGGYLLSGWLTMWFMSQFMSHWYYTIFGADEKKLAVYHGLYDRMYHLIPSSPTRIIPDFYHIVLHLLILMALALTLHDVLKRKG